MIVAHAETREELTCNAFKHFDWFFFFHNLIVGCNCKSIRNCRYAGWCREKPLIEFIKWFWFFKGISRSFCYILSRGPILPWMVVKRTFDLLQILQILKSNQLKTLLPTLLNNTTPPYNLFNSIQIENCFLISIISVSIFFLLDYCRLFDTLFSI